MYFKNSNCNWQKCTRGGHPSFLPSHPKSELELLLWQLLSFLIYHGEGLVSSWLLVESFPHKTSWTMASGHPWWSGFWMADDTAEILVGTGSVPPPAPPSRSGIWRARTWWRSSSLRYRVKHENNPDFCNFLCVILDSYFNGLAIRTVQ